MTPERYQALLRWLEARPALKKLVIALNRWLPAVPFACYPLLLVLPVSYTHLTLPTNSRV